MKGMGPIPPHFEASASGELLIGGRGVGEIIAEAGGTPLFVYDNNIVGTQMARFKAAMPDGVGLHYAVKANAYPPLLSFICRYIAGFDIASLGELLKLQDAELAGLPISFAGPGKRDDELEAAIAAGVTINLESDGEFGRAIRAAETVGVQPRLAVRVNPTFALRAAGMKMGGLASPFGIDVEQAPAVVRKIVESGADWRGLHIYAGSQCLDADALIEAHRETVQIAARVCEEAGSAAPEVNLGGGFGIPYFDGDRELDVEAVGRALGKTLGEVPQILATTRFAMELGRWLVGEAGVYVTRIVERKESGGRTFLVTDGGLHHFLAASGNFGQLLRRNYPIAVANRFKAEPEEEATVTGCLCTPLDLLGDEVALPRAEAGDLIAIFCAGAYGLSASPQTFLSQPEAKEILV